MQFARKITVPTFSASHAARCWHWTCAVGTPAKRTIVVSDSFESTFDENEFFLMEPNAFNPLPFLRLRRLHGHALALERRKSHVRHTNACALNLRKMHCDKLSFMWMHVTAAFNRNACALAPKMGLVDRLMTRSKHTLHPTGTEPIVKKCAIRRRLEGGVNKNQTALCWMFTADMTD
jgi:hypothetical protein